MPTMNWILRNRRRALRRLQGEGGFTIVELMVAISIFAILMAAAAIGMNTALNMTRNNKSRSVAANLAAQQIDQVQAMNFTSVPIGAQSSSQTVDSVVYTIVTDAEWVGPTTTTNSCSGGTNANPAYLRVSVSITWPQMNGVLPVRSQTLLTPPVGTYDPNSGNVAVQVFDRNAAPEGNISIALVDSSGNRTVQFTSADGCAFFAYESAGAYTVTANNPGFVDGQGTQSPTTTVTVVTGSTVTTQFTYDAAAELDLTMVGAAGGNVPDGISMVLANSQLLPSGTKRVLRNGPPPKTGPFQQITALFPYLSGYEAWAGLCLDDDPAGINPSTGQPFYSGGFRDPAYSTTPNGITPGNITLPSLNVRVVNTLGNPINGATVKVTHAADSVNGCTNTQTFTLSGTTNSSGTILNAIPFGLWQVSVVGKTASSGTWPSVTLAAPATSVATTLTVTVN